MPPCSGHHTAHVAAAKPNQARSTNTTLVPGAAGGFTRQHGAREPAYSAKHVAHSTLWIYGRQERDRRRQIRTCHCLTPSALSILTTWRRFDLANSYSCHAFNFSRQRPCRTGCPRGRTGRALWRRRHCQCSSNSGRQVCFSVPVLRCARGECHARGRYGAPPGATTSTRAHHRHLDRTRDASPVSLTMFFWSLTVRPARHVPNKLALNWALDILASPDPPQELVMEWFRSVPSSARFHI